MTTTKNKIKGFFWHVHHDKLLEWCYDYDERVNYIKTEKPSNEIQTRLRLMKPVREELPKEFVKAYKKWVEADKKWVEARKEWDEACKRLYEAYTKYAPQLETLHKKECGCKEWNGRKLVFK
jgi:hypothetical protein